MSCNQDKKENQKTRTITKKSTMNLPHRPEEMNEYFAKAYNSGEVDNLNNLFETNAKVVRKNGEVITGINKINAEHLNLLKLGGKMTSNNKYCVEIENIALLRADWKIETHNESGEILEIKGSSTEIVRKQKDGSWLYIVDNPFGANSQN